MRIIKSILLIAIMLGILVGGIYYIFFDKEDMKEIGRASCRERVCHRV